MTLCVTRALNRRSGKVVTESAWSGQATEEGSTVIAHRFEKSAQGPYCEQCGWPKENHL